MIIFPIILILKRVITMDNDEDYDNDDGEGLGFNNNKTMDNMILSLG
jgi:hypothetical protein